MRLGDANRRENERDERREERLERVRLENDRMTQVNVRQDEDDEHRQIRLINNRVIIPRTYNIARQPITDEIPASHNTGLLTTVCPHCCPHCFFLPSMYGSAGTL